MKCFYLQKKICVTIRDFLKVLCGIHELHCGINVYEENSLASMFKWLLHENEAFQEQNYYMTVYLHKTLSIIHHHQWPKTVVCGATLIKGPESPEGPQW